MFAYTIREAAFLTSFKEKLRQYINKSYKYTMQFLASPVVNDYHDNERLVLIAVNKSVYQNLYSFMHLNESNMQYAAFACLENALYAMRLYNALVLNPDYLHTYITSPDFSLEEAEREQDEKQQADPEKAEQFSVREFYHSLCKMRSEKT